MKPADIPDALEVDVANLAIGDTATVGDIRGTVSYEILDEDDFILVSVTAPRSQDELDELETPAAEDAEPEVVGGESDSEEKEA
nr:hypothetical protein [Planococcus glaciei]